MCVIREALKVYFSDPEGRGGGSKSGHKVLWGYECKFLSITVAEFAHVLTVGYSKENQFRVTKVTLVLHG
jgi:hypothetical protein